MLAVRGFAQQETVAVAQIAAALEWLPRFHLEGLREIVYVPHEPLSYPSLCAVRTGWAEYVQAERAVFVYRLEDAAQFWHVLYHEVGHHVYFLVLGSAAKTRWTGAIYPGSACATAYGYTGASEDFAECYALYARDTRSLDDFPDKQRYLREVVFSGLPGTRKEKAVSGAVRVL